MDKPTNRPKILIVDDEPINIRVMLNALKADYTTLVATDGYKALEIIDSANPPDLVLLDIMMPGMDGYEVCERIKSHQHHANLPVVFITAKASEAEEVRGLELGAIDYLTKPICLPVLKAKVKTHIELKQHRDFVELLLNQQFQELQSRDDQYEQDRMQQQTRIQRYIEEIQENQQRLKLSLWGSGDEFWIWQLDSGEYLRQNPLPLLLPEGEQRNSIACLEPYVHPEDYADLQECFLKHLERGATHFEATYRLRDQQGQWCWVMERGKVVETDSDGKPRKISGTLKDITHLKQAEQELLLAAKSFESISDAVWITDREFRVLKINRSFTEITGYSEAEVVGEPLVLPQNKESGLAFEEYLIKKLALDGRWQGEVWGTRKSGSHYPQDLQISVLRDLSGEISHYVGAFSDITYRKNAEDKLRYMANYDHLTGLPNRTLFMERLNHAVSVAQRNSHKMAVMFLDLDNFKTINDTLGHASGDILLREIASRLDSCVRDSDTVARLGGDEFTLILEKVLDVDEIKLVTQRLFKAIDAPINLAGHTVNVSASIGVVVFPDHGDNYRDLLRYADIAMYQAKNNGRNNAQLYTAEMNRNTLFRMELEKELHQLIEHDELVLHYQPKVRLRTGEVMGLEVLVRWQHPKHGLLPPNMFIPLAEETGHIVKMGEAILRKACRESKHLWDQGLMRGRLAVNLSAAQFVQEDLPERIEAILEETGFAVGNLELEITESTVMANQARAIEHMQQLQERGVHLSIDDFGTGYSSLSYLKGFPINTLKIDRCFVQDIEKSNKDKSIIASIISLAHHLNLNVVAEGVETQAQQELLKELQCEEMQGYLFSKPIPADAIEQLLMDERELQQRQSPPCSQEEAQTVCP